MKKEIKKYTVEEIILAGEIGEIPYMDVKELVSSLDEAKEKLKKNKSPKVPKKLIFGSIEAQYVMLNKALECKTMFTIEEINKTVDKTINGVYWLDYIEMTELEYSDWRDWCRNFLFDSCTPQHKPEWIRTQFADWSLLYPFKIKESYLFKIEYVDGTKEEKEFENKLDGISYVHHDHVLDYKIV